MSSLNTIASTSASASPSVGNQELPQPSFSPSAVPPKIYTTGHRSMALSAFAEGWSEAVKKKRLSPESLVTEVDKYFRLARGVCESRWRSGINQPPSSGSHSQGNIAPSLKMNGPEVPYGGHFSNEFIDRPGGPSREPGRIGVDSMIFSFKGDLPANDEEVDSEWESPERARAQRFGESQRTGKNQKKPKRPPMYRLMGALEPRHETGQSATPHASLVGKPTRDDRKWNVTIEKEATKHDGYANNSVSLTGFTTAQYNSLMCHTDIWPDPDDVQNKRRVESVHFEPISHLYKAAIPAGSPEPSTQTVTRSKPTQSAVHTSTPNTSQSIGDEEGEWREWVEAEDI